VLIGGASGDILGGGPRNDRLRGRIGEDQLFGNAGHDLLHAKDGWADSVHGGSGFDDASVDSFDVVDTVENFF
jgi:hypothetical protein